MGWGWGASIPMIMLAQREADVPSDLSEDLLALQGMRGALKPFCRPPRTLKMPYVMMMTTSEFQLKTQKWVVIMMW